MLRRGTSASVVILPRTGRIVTLTVPRRRTLPAGTTLRVVMKHPLGMVRQTLAVMPHRRARR